MFIKPSIISQYYQIFINLSVDVVIGVWLQALVIQYYFLPTTNQPYIIGITLATWAVYLIDHMLDAHRIEPQNQLSKQRFFKQHQLKLIIFLVVIILSIGAMATVADGLLLAAGFSLLLPNAVHLVMVKKNKFPNHWLFNKEMSVALLYSLGICLYPLMVNYNTIRFDVVFELFIILILVTYQNLIMISVVEYTVDITQRSDGFITKIGKASGQWMFFGLSLFTLLYCANSLINKSLPNELVLLYTCISVSHVILFARLNNRFIGKHYRKIAEALFWIPVISLFL